MYVFSFLNRARVVLDHHRVCIQNVSVCARNTSMFMWTRCGYTRRRFECTHGGVLNRHTASGVGVGGQRDTPTPISSCGCFRSRSSTCVVKTHHGTRALWFVNQG